MLQSRSGSNATEKQSANQSKNKAKKQFKDCNLPPCSRQRSRYHLKHQNQQTSLDANSPHKQKRLRLQLAKERKASTTLGIIMSAFTICWLPFFVLTVVRICLSNPDAIPGSLSSIFLWLGYCNSLLNPVIYATLNRDFRKPFREILYFRCGNLQHMMREEFYQSQYGDPVNNYYVRSTNESLIGTSGGGGCSTTTASATLKSSSSNVVVPVNEQHLEVPVAVASATSSSSVDPPSESFL